MSEPTLIIFRFLALSPDVATALNSARPDLHGTPAVHVLMSDKREFVVLEGGGTLEVQRAGQVNELVEEVLV